MNLNLELQSSIKEHYRVFIGLGCVWLAFVLNEIVKGYYFSSGNISILYYSLFGLYLYLPWFLFSAGILFLARLTLYQPILSPGSLVVHLPVSILWAGAHVILLTSAYWVFWPERVTQVSVGFVLGEQALKWFHFEVLAYFLLLGIWRRRLLKPDAINATKSSSDENGTLSLITDSGL